MTAAPPGTRTPAHESPTVWLIRTQRAAFHCLPEKGARVSARELALVHTKSLYQPRRPLKPGDKAKALCFCPPARTPCQRDPLAETRHSIYIFLNKVSVKPVALLSTPQPGNRALTSGPIPAKSGPGTDASVKDGPHHKSSPAPSGSEPNYPPTLLQRQRAPTPLLVRFSVPAPQQQQCHSTANTDLQLLRSLFFDTL